MASSIKDGLLSAVIDTATSGDNTIISAVAGQKIYIFRLWFWVNGTVTVTLKNGAGTNLAGGMACLAQNCPTWDLDDEPWFIVSAGNAFIINLNAAIQVSGRVYYKQQS